MQISLALAVYEAEKHPTLDGVPASPTDSKRMLEAYIAVELAGLHPRELVVPCAGAPRARVGGLT